MKVSVIIPNYNYSRFVCEAVDSALAQTYQDKEVIVIDDGSTDNSIELLAKYGNTIRLIEQPNAGVCAARNNGVAVSSGELVAFLDADDVWMPTKLEKQVEQFKKDPAIVLSHVGVLDIDADGNILAAHTDGMSGKVCTDMLLFERPVILGACSGAMWPKTVFESVGGFDSRLSTAADWDLCFRTARQGKVAFVPETLFKYRLHGTNMHGNIDVMEHDMLLCYQKAFETAPDLDGIKDRAYGALYRVLAGSYFQAGQYGGFLLNAAKSIWRRPASLKYFLEFPLRKMRRENDGSPPYEGGVRL